MSKPSFQEWDVEEVQSKIKEGVNLEIIDVREDDEWESGHIPQAKHIALGTLQERHPELDPEQLTIIVCRSGARSNRACEYLTELGYKVVNMTGGMLEWEEPVTYGK